MGSVGFTSASSVASLVRSGEDGHSGAGGLLGLTTSALADRQESSAVSGGADVNEFLDIRARRVTR